MILPEVGLDVPEVVVLGTIRSPGLAPADDFFDFSFLQNLKVSYL